MNPDILFYAFRYALGRRTYAVGLVAAELIKHCQLLPKQTRVMICNEIEDAQKRDGLGDRCDIEQWERVLKELSV